MKSFKCKILASLCLLTLSATAFAGRKTIREIEMMPYLYSPSNVQEWVLAGHARLTAKMIFNLWNRNNYERTMTDLDLSYLKNTDELCIEVGEEKAGEISEVRLTCTNNEIVDYKFSDAVHFTRSSKGLSFYIPLNDLDGCVIKSIDVEGYTSSLDGARVRMNFRVPKSEVLEIKTDL